VTLARELAKDAAKQAAKETVKKGAKKGFLRLVATIGWPYALLIILVVLMLLFAGLVVPLAMFTNNVFSPYGNAPYGYYDGGVGMGLSPVLADWVVVPGGEYNVLRDYGRHRGIDLAVPLGTPVVAVVPGIARHARSQVGGIMIHLYGDDGRVYVYMHLGERTVPDGKHVKPGEVIGRVGMTGRTTGPHLHFEVLENGSPVDPRPFINGNIALNEMASYKTINTANTIDWINSYTKGQSLLATRDNISVLERVSREFNINPNLLIAITGQEQSFVPYGSDLRMLGNPFNVYGSWTTYSPGLETSARIAARTVTKLSRGRPEDVHPIYWLNCPDNPNGMYATDQGWWRGVTWFYNQLENNN